MRKENARPSRNTAVVIDEPPYQRDEKKILEKAGIDNYEAKIAAWDGHLAAYESRLWLGKEHVGKWMRA